MTDDAAALRERVLAYMRDETLDSFDELALAVFAHQYERNRPYRAFCDARGARPAALAHWSEIPAVPTDAFKAVPLVCGEADAAEAVFRTSGTTRGAARRGTHFVLHLSPYHTALRLGFEGHLLHDGARMPILGLVPPPGELPDSSLSHMVGDVMEEFGTSGSGWFVSSGGGLATDPLLHALRGAERTGRPLLLAGTSFTFVHLFDAMRERDLAVRLPPGSRVMDTGGFKGRSREVDRSDFLAAYAERLGLSSRWIVNEYGMTEMTSQFYDGVAGAEEPGGEARPYRGPHWVRTRAADAETLELLPAGETGVLRHWDLGNLDSVVALQTADMGRVGSGGFELFGRAAGAEARGCSIAMDELLLSVRGSERP